MSLTLKDGSGNVVAMGTGAKPTTISAPVTAGQYTLSATPLSGTGDATLTASYPGRGNREVIAYDGNDHATSIEDGTTLVSETLSPSGRVLRRVVQDSITYSMLEDTTFGYDDGGDSPAYSKPTAGGPVTTYLEAGSGLSAIDVGGTITYQLANLHGDVIGTTDTAGTFTAIGPTDEFGLGTAPQSRLGWLGAKERFTADTRLGLIRMGVRLYDPALGRFLEVDPVEGGSANDYDYVAADPIDNLDLAGTNTVHGNCGVSSLHLRLVRTRSHGRIKLRMRVVIGFDFLCFRATSYVRGIVLVSPSGRRIRYNISGGILNRRTSWHGGHTFEGTPREHGTWVALGIIVATGPPRRFASSDGLEDTLTI
jgi:RHS repeat-associated protein